MKSLLLASLVLMSSAVVAADTPAPAVAPTAEAAGAPGRDESASPAASPGAGATAAPGPANQGPSVITGDIAKRHQQARLEREIDRLQAQIDELPADIDSRALEARQSRDELGYESWLLHQEGDALRDSIERLRVRITLLESITRSQELLERVRLVELQNALTAINTDDRQVTDDRQLARERLTQATLQIATRQATLERLAEVQRQLDALAPVAAAPAAAPASNAAPVSPAAPAAGPGGH